MVTACKSIYVKVFGNDKIIKIQKRKLIILLLFFEQGLLSNYKRYHHGILHTYSKHSNGGKGASEFLYLFLLCF